jgi:hypothetical protein
MVVDSVEDSSGPREGSFFKAATESSTGGDAMSVPKFVMTPLP